ncbi:MAG: RHS repeat-associated core domain-containing protein, partial [Myxococcota bacterium]
YDGAGNRSSEQCFGQTSVDYGYANGSNRLASQSWAASEAVCGPSASEVVRDSTHDARGRATLAYRDAFLGTPEAYGLRYGPFGRLSGVDLDADGSDDVGYLYDDAGLRRSKTDASGAATQRFHYSLGGALLGESGTDGARDYIWVAGELIGVVDDAGAAYHLTTDHLGSPRRAFDASSELAWGVDMEAFGRAHPRADAIQIPIRFPGQYEDAETGLHYNWNRFYNPTTGRYLAEDPLVSELPGFGESVYGYARNNPALYTDPDGRCPICIAAGIIVAEAIADLLVVGGTAAGVVAGTQVIDHYMNESQGDGGSCEESGSNGPGRELSAEERRAIRSHEKRIKEHLDKIEAFKKDPTVRPGMEDQPDEVIREQQRRRVEKLEREVQKFRDNIEKIRTGR